MTTGQEACRTSQGIAKLLQHGRDSLGGAFQILDHSLILRDAHAFFRFRGEWFAHRTQALRQAGQSDLAVSRSNQQPAQERAHIDGGHAVGKAPTRPIAHGIH